MFEKNIIIVSKKSEIEDVLDIIIKFGSQKTAKNGSQKIMFLVKPKSATQKRLLFKFYNSSTEELIARFLIKFSNKSFQNIFMNSFNSYMQKLQKYYVATLNPYKEEYSMFGEYKNLFILSKENVKEFIEKLSTYFNVKKPELRFIKNQKISFKTEKTNVIVYGRISKATLQIDFFGMPLPLEAVAHEFTHYLLLLKSKNVSHDKIHIKMLKKVMMIAINEPALKNLYKPINF